MANWTREQVGLFNELSLSEQLSLSWNHNGYTLFLLNKREEYYRKTEEEQLVYRIQPLHVDDDEEPDAVASEIVIVEDNAGFLTWMKKEGPEHHLEWCSTCGIACQE